MFDQHSTEFKVITQIKEHQNKAHLKILENSHELPNLMLEEAKNYV